MSYSDGELLTGVQYDPRFNLSYPFTQQVYNYEGDSGVVHTTGQEAVTGTDQTPKDSKSATVRTFDISAITAARLTYFRNYSVSIPVDLPVVLTGITTLFNKGEGTSVDDHPAANADSAVIGAGTASMNLRASTNASASTQPALAPTFKQYPRTAVAMQCELFFSGSFTAANLIARLSAASALNATVNSWPVFTEKSETFILKGQSVSVGAKADTEVSVSTNTTASNLAYSYAYGQGTSQQFSNNNVVQQLPACIHGAITLSPTSQSAIATSNAEASTPAAICNGSTIVPAISNATGVVTLTANSSITPTSLSATSVAAVPGTGLYLYDWKIDTTVGYGGVFVTAFVIDMAQFA